MVYKKMKIVFMGFKHFHIIPHNCLYGYKTAENKGFSSF